MLAPSCPARDAACNDASQMRDPGLLFQDTGVPGLQRTVSRCAAPGTRRASNLRLLDLDQRAAKVLRVQEQHRLTVGADLRIAVAEDARAFRLELVARGQNIVDLVADVVDAAVRIALEE